MIGPPIPLDDRERTETLHDLGILDTAPDERFDRVTRLACALFDVPVALVSFVDAKRQWFKSRHGLDTTETDRAISFCSHAILRNDPLVVPDARLDPRFHENPLVTGAPFIRFYAGRPLATPDGHRLGTLCIIDREPRVLSADELDRLDDLASIVDELLATMDLATTDALTGLANLRGFRALSENALAVAARSRRQTAVVSFRLPEVREITQVEGAGAAEALLSSFADALSRVFRKGDVLGRCDGDEFCVFMTAVGPSLMPNLVERLRLDLACSRERGDKRVPRDFRHGCAYRGRDENLDLDELMSRADQDLLRRTNVTRDQSA